MKKENEEIDWRIPLYRRLTLALFVFAIAFLVIGIVMYAFSQSELSSLREELDLCKGNELKTNNFLCDNADNFFFTVDCTNRKVDHIGLQLKNPSSPAAEEYDLDLCIDCFLPCVLASTVGTGVGAHIDNDAYGRCLMRECDRYCHFDEDYYLGTNIKKGTFNLPPSLDNEEFQRKLVLDVNRDMVSVISDFSFFVDLNFSFEEVLGFLDEQGNELEWKSYPDYPNQFTVTVPEITRDTNYISVRYTKPSPFPEPECEEWECFSIGYGSFIPYGYEIVDSCEGIADNVDCFNYVCVKHCLRLYEED